MNGMTPTNKLTPMEEAYLAVQEASLDENASMLNSRQMKDYREIKALAKKDAKAALKKLSKLQNDWPMSAWDELDAWINRTYLREGMKTDKVDPKQAKKDFDDRDDKDIDNDGDVDSSDKFLHKRRKAIAKNELDEAKIEYGIIRYPDTAISYVKNSGNGWEHIYDRSYGFKGKVDSADLKHMSPIDKSKIPGRLIKEYVELDEAFSDSHIAKLKKEYEPLRTKRISLDHNKKLNSIIDKISHDKDALEKLYKADIPFVTQTAMVALMLKHNYKAADFNKLME